MEDGLSTRIFPRFLGKVPEVLAIGLGLGLAVAFKKSQFWVASRMGHYAWLYMLLLLVILFLLIVLSRELFSGFSRKLMIVSVLPWFVVSFGGYSYMKLQKMRAEVVSERATLVQHYTVNPVANPTDRMAGFVPIGSLYQLSFQYPQAMYENEDGEIELSNVYISPDMLEALKPLVVPSNPEIPIIGGMPRNMRDSIDMQKIDATVHMVSQSFAINPSEEVKFPLVGGGPRLKFVITPKEVGKRKILVRSRLRSDVVEALRSVAEFDLQNTMLYITVLPERTVFGLTGAHIQQIQLISTAIGFPALTVTMLTLFREYRKEKRVNREKKAKGRAKR
jgi:hypothetical protein